MESKNYATEINEANVGRLIQYHANGAWRIGTLASVNTENVQVTPITGGHEQTVSRDDTRLVIREAEKPKANKAKPGMPELPPKPKAKVAKPKVAKKAKPKTERRFNLKAAFERARARMKDPNRKKCKHGHPITAKNACVADLRRMGRYCCAPCIKKYARRQQAKELKSRKKAGVPRDVRKPASKKAGAT